MAKNQKHYTPEFKQQIVDLYHAGGTSYPQLERNFEAETINQKWCTDITYIHVLEEIYLHTYQDSKEALII